MIGGIISCRSPVFLSGGRYKSAILRKSTGIFGDHGESPDIVETNTIGIGSKNATTLKRDMPKANLERVYKYSKGTGGTRAKEIELLLQVTLCLPFSYRGISDAS